MAVKFKFDIDFRVVNDNVVVCYAIPTTIDPRILKAERVLGILGYVCIRDKKEFKGVAVRKPDDEVDIELAKAIARRKAVRAALKFYRGYHNEIFNRLIEYSTRTAELVDSYDKKIGKLTYEIEDLCDEISW